MYMGTQREILRQQSMNKAFWSHFKHFGKLLGKMYLFLTPSKTDERVPSQQGAPTTCNLTYWEVFQHSYVQTLLASLGVVTGQNWPLQLAGRWGERFLIIARSSYSRQLFPATLSFQGHIIVLKSSSQQKFAWRTDILRNRSVGCSCI